MRSLLATIAVVLAFSVFTQAHAQALKPPSAVIVVPPVTFITFSVVTDPLGGGSSFADLVQLEDGMLRSIWVEATQMKGACQVEVFRIVGGTFTEIVDLFYLDDDPATPFTGLHEMIVPGSGIEILAGDTIRLDVEAHTVGGPCIILVIYYFDAL